ncbi:hypothetical protein, partial [Arthrobacter sp.]|uniref:hypothetical protein n=1 Tax=Arthrobacter sp. TaxID=1667 RepID=UPI0028999B41
PQGPARAVAQGPAQPLGPGTDPALDLRAALAVVQDAERAARRNLGGNTPQAYLIWGLTWVVGYGALWASQKGSPLAPETALVILGVALATATVSTIMIFARSSKGIRGQSAFQGGMYGAAWALGFTVMGIISSIIGRLIEDFWLRGMLVNSIAVLIVGLLYITGGTTFNDRAQSYLGVWLLVVTLIGLMSGPDHFLAVFLFLGSPGLLLGALVEYLRTRRRRTAAADA